MQLCTIVLLYVLKIQHLRKVTYSFKLYMHELQNINVAKAMSYISLYHIHLYAKGTKGEHSNYLKTDTMGRCKILGRFIEQRSWSTYKTIVIIFGFMSTFACYFEVYDCASCIQLNYDHCNDRN